MQRHRRRRCEVGIGQEEPPATGAGADAGHQLDDVGQARNEARDACDREPEQAPEPPPGGHHGAHREGRGQHEDIPRVGGRQHRRAETAQEGCADPPAARKLHHQPAPHEGGEHHRQGDEVTVEVGKQRSPERVLVDGEAGNHPRGGPPHVEPPAGPGQLHQGGPGQVAGEQHQHRYQRCRRQLPRRGMPVRGPPAGPRPAPGMVADIRL